MITQKDMDLIHDADAFRERIEPLDDGNGPLWLQVVCAVAIALILIAYHPGLWR